jgi:flagellin-like protein
MTGDRGQSNVVGVAIMLGVTVVALATVTASVGTVVQDSAATADATRVSEAFDDALRPVEATGPHRGTVSFTEGELSVVDRELRVLDASGVVRTVSVDALEFRTGDQRVVYLAGAVVRETGAGSQLAATPPLTASRGSGGVLVVGAPVLNANDRTVGASGSTTVLLDSDVSHDRTTLGNGTYRVAVETTTPDVWRRYFERRGASVSGRRDFEGDGVDSVVAQFPGERVGYLVVHDLRLEVRVRG